MAEVHLCTGLDPDTPEEVTLVLVVDPQGAPGERAVASLGDGGYEGDGVLYLVCSDGWVERWLDGDTLVVDVVAYPAALDGAGVEPETLAGRSPVDPAAMRLLRVTTRVDPARYAAASRATVVWCAPAGCPVDRVLADIRAGADWPLICAPPPEPR